MWSSVSVAGRGQAGGCSTLGYKVTESYSGGGSPREKDLSVTFVLGIETSCDETAAGIVASDGSVLSNVVASQVEIHARYGGIVPEVASRQHVLQAGPVIRQAVATAGLTWHDISAVAVTNGPGLAGSLIAGVNAAKGLAAALGVPLVGVNHLEGHMYGAWASSGHGWQAPEEQHGFPIMCLIVSGGHTELVLMRDHGDFAVVGETRDDAAGEAFDKAARVLGLGYPGGPAVQRAAEGAGAAERFPRAWLADSADFSFSGLKSALVRRARELGIYPAPTAGAPAVLVRALARAFQEAVVDVLVSKTVQAAGDHGCTGIVVAGGVAANAALRQRMALESPVPVTVPHISLCTDNGAMVAVCGSYRYRAGVRSGMDLDVVPGLRAGSEAWAGKAVQTGG